MSCRQILSKVVWILSLLSILCGFIFQSWGVWKEYFEYRTSTFVAIQDYPEKAFVVPSLIICFLLDTEMRVQSLGNFFNSKDNYLNDNDDSWKVVSARARIPYNEKADYLTKKFLMGNKYCLFFKMINLFTMEEVTSSRHSNQTNFYTLSATITPIHSTRVLGPSRKLCRPKYTYFKIVADESVLSNPRTREQYREVCTKDQASVGVALTYSSLVNVNLPPPYDTNCLNYREEGHFMSSHHCFDECIKERMSRRKIVPGMTFIERHKYNQSRELMMSGKVLEGREVFDVLERRNTSKSKGLIKYFQEIQYEWKKNKTFCRRVCFRPDCISEDSSPQVSNFYEDRKNNSNITSIFVELRTSYQPTIRVSSIPKQNLIDFIVYMSSMSSFWLGFCPLTLAASLVKRLRKYHGKTRMRKRSVEDRLEDRLENAIILDT